jgi:sulfur transfer protein SufE
MSAVIKNHEALLNRFLLIEDPQERLAAILHRTPKIPRLPSENCTESLRVEGCVSRVWLRASFTAGLCAFELEAESQLVRALAALVCEPCHMASPLEIGAYSEDLLAQLRITPQLTPTRQNGLAQVQARIRLLAAAYVD